MLHMRRPFFEFFKDVPIEIVSDTFTQAPLTRKFVEGIWLHKITCNADKKTLLYLFLTLYKTVKRSHQIIVALIFDSTAPYKEVTVVLNCSIFNLRLHSYCPNQPTVMYFKIFGPLHFTRTMLRGTFCLCQFKVSKSTLMPCNTSHN